MFIRFFEFFSSKHLFGLKVYQEYKSVQQRHFEHLVKEEGLLEELSWKPRYFKAEKNLEVEANSLLFFTRDKSYDSYDHWCVQISRTR